MDVVRDSAAMLIHNRDDVTGMISREDASYGSPICGHQSPFQKMMERHFGIGNSRRPMAILTHVSQETGIPLADILGPSRKPRAVRARWLAFLRLRNIGFSYCRIGQLMNRDHSTVIYGVRKAQEL